MSDPNNKEPVMFGLYNTNRKRENHFTKNCFNSSFPIALLCYMGDKGIDPHYITIASDRQITNLNASLVPSFLKIPVFGNASEACVLPVSKDVLQCLQFNFESNYEKRRFDVVASLINSETYWPFEIKLTTVPDSTTVKLGENNWAPELVVRRVTYEQALFLIAIKIQQFGYSHSCDLSAELTSLKDGEVPDCRLLEMARDLLTCVERLNIQTPFLLQPLWWTKLDTDNNRSQIFLMEKGTFDYVIWSDLAIAWLPYYLMNAGKRTTPQPENGNKSRNDEKSRIRRAVFKLVLVLSRVLSNPKLSTQEWFKDADIPSSVQTDKEFSVSGSRFKDILRLGDANTVRLPHGRLDLGVLWEVITVDKQALFNNLRPERRLDASIWVHLLKDLRSG